jgi:beta-D-xylosidase 4
MVHFSAVGLATVASLTPVLLAAIGPDCVNGPLASNKICDVTADPKERAAALVAAMQPEEKLRNLVRYVSDRGQKIKSSNE